MTTSNRIGAGPSGTPKVAHLDGPRLHQWHPVALCDSAGGGDLGRIFHGILGRMVFVCLAAHSFFSLVVDTVDAQFDRSGNVISTPEGGGGCVHKAVPFAGSRRAMQ